MPASGSFDGRHVCLQIWAQFDTKGDGELAYEQVLQLLQRQLPQLERAEMKQLLSYLHQIDTDGELRVLIFSRVFGQQHNAAWNVVAGAYTGRACSSHESCLH